MRSRSQIYAETIYAKVNSVSGIETGEKKRYGALCHRFAFIVRENGLAAAFGFLAAKGGPDAGSAEKRLLGHFAEVLGAAGAAALQQMVSRAGLAEYRRLTRQTLAANEWFKRYAEAILKVGPTGEEEDAHV
ncbi:MAG: type III-B CRISPR module-associated protein Cmr5 [Desulfobacteraceae bacterium]|nr:type III-B CRISPR module-associated protein Cmr5 [Desulfobacteraceae bacterium]